MYGAQWQPEEEAGGLAKRIQTSIFWATVCLPEDGTHESKVTQHWFNENCLDFDSKYFNNKDSWLTNMILFNLNPLNHHCALSLAGEFNKLNTKP